MVGELIPDSQSLIASVKSIEVSFFARGGNLTRVETRRRLERITKAYRSVEEVDMYHLKRDVCSTTVLTSSNAQHLIT